MKKFFTTYSIIRLTTLIFILSTSTYSTSPGEASTTSQKIELTTSSASDREVCRLVVKDVANISNPRRLSDELKSIVNSKCGQYQKVCRAAVQEVARISGLRIRANTLESIIRSKCGRYRQVCRAAEKEAKMIAGPSIRANTLRSIREVCG